MICLFSFSLFNPYDPHSKADIVSLFVVVIITIIDLKDERCKTI